MNDDADKRCDSDTDTHFSDDWLRLREAADHRARHPEPTRVAAGWLTRRSDSSDSGGPAQAPRAVTLVDLGCGSGSNLRYLAPRLPGAQQWRLIDHDAALLERARERCTSLVSADGDPVQVDTCQATLAESIARGFEGVDLVSASALFDLLTAGEIDSLAGACVDAGCAVLFALSVDGGIHFHDPLGDSVDDEEDRFIFALYEAHQRRDKGAGAALGTDAPRKMRDTFERRGYRVVDAASPWRLDVDSLPLVEALMEGWRHALHQQAPESGARIERWHAARLERIRLGQVRLSVGHRDLVALPPGSAT
ncbi:class I SAM-dependent methyltransferase [Salinicola aestuarinus]|uniref:class I SAM-dependent methyltransferase n=1 Tax=Salinicola aestuarinus TaxID=1949082 RepID=UPI000DA155EC|nr:class I SAM-dependent methyltransferase [Salinicola aestuarinus]